MMFKEVRVSKAVSVVSFEFHEVIHVKLDEVQVPV